MLMMENAEEVQQALERFTKLKQTQIPNELEEYLCFVAKTGDTIFRWSVIKTLFREKLIAVIKQFHEQTAIDDLPHYPNVDPFNYETMKASLLERLDSFSSAPFTVQRICELLTDPRKQYSRIDKFMRAIEKTILVVSTVEPGRPKSLADSSDYSDSLDSMVNGSSNVTGGALGDDLAGDIDVDIELENGTATMSGQSEGATAAAAAAPLPSINTLNSAILAANQGTQGTDLLGQQINDEEVDDEEDDDDEDVVHNHLTTDPAEDGTSETDAATRAPSTGSEEAEEHGTKRAEEDEEESEGVKRAKVEEEETVKPEESIPEKPETAVEKEEEAAPVPPAQVTDTQPEEEEKPKANSESSEPVAPATAESEEQSVGQELPATVEEAEERNEVVSEESAVNEPEIPTETTLEPIPSDTVAAVEPIVPDVAEKDAPSPEEVAMDEKPAETLDPMEAEPTPIVASEMDVDSSEGTTSGPAIISEESVSMDEPMEDQ